MLLTRHILVTISESLYTVYIRSNDEVINGRVNMSLRIDAELKDAFMAAAKAWTVMASVNPGFYAPDR
ncbi:hypothetical protein DMI62_04245 [Escherichia coli]|nr:hypothetical protein [Escherichia coli]